MNKRQRYVFDSLKSLEDPSSLPPSVDDHQPFLDYYLDFYDKVHIILLDVYFRRWHWYTIYNHKKFGKVLCSDGIVRLIPYVKL